MSASTAMVPADSAVAKRDPKLAHLEGQLMQLLPRIQELLPQQTSDPHRFLRMVMMACVKNPALLEPARRKSLFAAVLHAAELGLSCSGGPASRAHLVPYRDEVTCIPDYKGLIDIALDSGFYEGIEAEVVRKNDRFVYRRGLAPILEHDPKLDGDRGEMIAAYAIAWPKGGGRPSSVVMFQGEIEQVRDDSPGYKSGKKSPWNQHPSEMAKKTVIRRLFKTLKTSRSMDAGGEDRPLIDISDLATIDDIAGPVEISDGEKAERVELLKKIASAAQLRGREAADAALEGVGRDAGENPERLTLDELRSVYAALEGPVADEKPADMSTLTEGMRRKK